VLLFNGIQADLRLVDRPRGAALQHFTGSKSHNIAPGTARSAAGFA
jgi:DNA polymerase/3'-5' exonuclease PolX